ncbi:hypothetical protein DPEC_G00360950 [Dallia pectoralis]|uniref:Uncharacterized protein n=1 Tax=Dallia pectoralis TaxID=75939 RepID=A0ACC2F1C8_DALPE|nr:hypothetical protein DPEC_G00360950 [Dallia pectoralis]
MDAGMACLLAMCLCLVLPVGWSQGSHQSKEFINPQLQPDPGERQDQPLAAAHVQDMRSHALKQLYANTDNSNTHLSLFIAAALGVMILMGVVYCVYTQFYTKHPYLHTELQDSDEMSLDLPEAPPVVFHSSVGAMDRQEEVWRAANGSLISDAPSIISVPPRLSPPPSAMPYPSFFLSAYPLRTISVRNLEKSFF